ncbi:hypothetical protein AB832_06880 [Flavobacteriaceae bacterium (ex Bugula neritina AB1)]|nr:hypothetical protein AB832_06880 [Flavobacteriaceae bacterium (ex Bugula neritina AB1)]
MKKKRKRYDKAFKLMVVELVLAGKSPKTVSKDLEIKADYVRRWVKEYKGQKEGVFSGNGNRNLTEMEKKVLALEKELKDSKLENEILKKAVGIFSKRN